MMERRSQPGALNGPVNFSQEPHHIHDKTIDTSPGTGPNNIHDSVPEDDVSIVTNIKELFEEQDEKENVEAESKIMLLSPIKEVLQVWKHHCIDLSWSPLQEVMETPIPSNQNLLPVTQLVQYTQIYS
jgi:hypothetical protein